MSIKIHTSRKCLSKYTPPGSVYQISNQGSVKFQIKGLSNSIPGSIKFQIKGLSNSNPSQLDQIPSLYQIMVTPHFLWHACVHPSISKMFLQYSSFKLLFKFLRIAGTWELADFDFPASVCIVHCHIVTPKSEGNGCSVCCLASQVNVHCKRKCNGSRKKLLSFLLSRSCDRI